MAKVVAKKVEEVAEAQTKTTVHAGVKIVDEQASPLDAATVKLLIEGWRLKKDIEDLKRRLDEINDQLIEAHGTGCALVATGVCRASLAERETVKITDAERLRALLGERFDDLVKVDVAYKPEKQLIAMACSCDEPLQPFVGACLSVGKSSAITWRAER